MASNITAETHEFDLIDDPNFCPHERLHQKQFECGDSSNIIDMDTEVNTSTEQGITDDDDYSTTSVTTMTTNNPISSNVTNNISETMYALDRKEVPGDGSCLYWSFLYAMSLLWLTAQDLRNLVAHYILQMDIDDSKLQFGADCQNRQQYCDKIRSGAWGGESELVALSRMYHIIIKVVNLRRDQQQNLPVNPINHGEDDKSCTNCIYIIFDNAKLHYVPLYLYNKENLQDKRTIFDLHDTCVDILLPDFVKNEIDLYDILSEIRNVAPCETHEFRTGEHPGNDQTFYAASTFLFDRSKMINVKCLRKNVADVIRSHTDTDGIHVPPSLDYQNREDYCRKVEEGIISGREPERNGLSYLYPDTLFCIISKPNMNNNAPCIDIYVKDISSYKKCIIILYDEASDIYMPLYLHNKINDEEEKINFKYDDTVKNLLREFIQNKLKYWGYVNFDSEKDNHAMDSPLHIENESDDLSGMINDTFIKNKSKEQNMKKRKAPEDNENSIIINKTKKSTSNTSNDNIWSFTSSRPVPSTNQMSTFHKRNDISGNIDTLLQIATIRKLMEEQQQMEDLSPTLSTNTSVPACREQMRLETDLIKEFRARVLSDYVPKSETKRDGTKAKLRNPSYFPDCNNQHYLNLLIPTMHLFADLRHVWIEIALVTRTINGCIYFNPLFDFYPYYDGLYGDPCNPMFIKLEDDKTYPLTKYTDELQKLKLKLVVIMLTNAELVKKQPLKVFPSLSSNVQIQDTKHRAHDKLKNDFHLNDLRFAITLWTQEPNDKEHQRRPDIQYISPISTQDKKFKVKG